MAAPDEVLENTVQRCRERDIIIPTYREMADPTLVPDGIRGELAEIGLWDLHGAYTETSAAVDFERYLLGAGIDHMRELGYWDRKRIHNLKYFTWVEQQGKSVEELDAQWYDDDYWTAHFHAWEEWDERITEFNERTGLLAKYR